MVVKFNGVAHCLLRLAPLSNSRGSLSKMSWRQRVGTGVGNPEQPRREDLLRLKANGERIQPVDGLLSDIVRTVGRGVTGQKTQLRTQGSTCRPTRHKSLGGLLCNLES